MSYLQELKDVNILYNNNFNIPIEFKVDEQYSTEGLSFKKMGELLVNAIKGVIDFFKKIGNWIVSLSRKLFKQNKTKDAALKVEAAIKIGALNDSDIITNINSKTREYLNDIIEDTKQEYNDISSQGTVLNEGQLLEANPDVLNKAGRDYFNKTHKAWAFMLFEKDGQPRKISKLIADCQVFVSERMKMYNDFKKEDLSSFSSDGTYGGDKLGIKNLGAAYSRFINLIIQRESYFIDEIPEFNWKNGESLIKPLNDADVNYREAMRFYEVYASKLEKELKTLEQDIIKVVNIRGNEQEGVDRTKYWGYKFMILLLSDILKVAYFPVYALLQQQRFYFTVIGELEKAVADMVVPVPADTKLYHVSNNGGLHELYPNTGMLHPKLPDTGTNQLLPARTSFSPTVENCFIGVPKYFSSFSTQDITVRPPTKSSADHSIILYLYEGIPDNDTKMIKEEIMRLAVGEELFSKEVAITTPIKLKKMGKIRVDYNPGRDGIDFNIGNVVNWEEYYGNLEPK